MSRLINRHKNIIRTYRSNNVFYPKYVNSENVIIQWVYSDCIFGTILDL